MKKKNGSVIGRIIVGVLAILGILFILLLIMPDDEEDPDGRPSPISGEVEAGGEEGGNGSGKDGKEEETQISADDEKPSSSDPKDPVSPGVEPVSIGTDAKSATILIYMNGSDLESEAGEATADISEMLSSGIGENVNVLIQTMGTRKWHDYGISSKTAQIHRIKNGTLELVKDDLGQLDCSSPDTLSDFIKFGKKNYPADRYILLFWDHGGGPVYGFGYDEWQVEGASLTIDEMKKALSANADIHFDIIGMDCCIMASLETCYALSPYCKYSLLSEDFESGLGWSYKGWMQKFEKDPAMSTPLLGKKIIDSMISANEEDSEYGDSSTMILVNERAVPDLMEKWIKYAYGNEDSLLGINYSKLHMSRGKSFFSTIFNLWNEDESPVTMEDYYVSDVLSIVESVGKEGQLSDDLRSALKASIAYYGHTSDTNELTGMAVSLPYGDPDFYDQLSEIYLNCGIDSEYVDWLEKFVDAPGSENYNDYSDFEESWEGWGSFEEGYGSCDPGDTDDWTYDYEEDVWYLYDDGVLYLYDDETETTFYYDEYEDEMYYYDEDDDEWYPAE